MMVATITNAAYDASHARGRISAAARIATSTGANDKATADTSDMAPFRDRRALTVSAAHVRTMARVGRNAADAGTEVAIRGDGAPRRELDSVVSVIRITGRRSGACRALLACGLRRTSRWERTDHEPAHPGSGVRRLVIFCGYGQ